MGESALMRNEDQSGNLIEVGDIVQVYIGMSNDFRGCTFLVERVNTSSGIIAGPIQVLGERMRTYTIGDAVRFYNTDVTIIAKKDGNAPKKLNLFDYNFKERHANRT